MGVKKEFKKQVKELKQVTRVGSVSDQEQSKLSDRQKRCFAEFAGRKGGNGAPYPVAADPEASNTDS